MICCRLATLLDEAMRLPRGAQYPAHAFVVAQLDFLEAGARGIRFTPTFAFWRKGRKAMPCCCSFSGVVRAPHTACAWSMLPQRCQAQALLKRLPTNCSTFVVHLCGKMVMWNLLHRNT